METYDRAFADFQRRIENLGDSFESDEYPTLNKVFKMDPQDCYSLFGVSNDSLEDLETLERMLLNGLYDDSYLGVVREGTMYVVSNVPDTHPVRLSEEDLLALVEAKAKQSTFYKINELTIEGGGGSPELKKMRRDYFKLGEEFRELLKSFMSPEDLQYIEAIDADRRKAMNELITRVKEAKCTNAETR